MTDHPLRRSRFRPVILGAVLAVAGAALLVPAPATAHTATRTAFVRAAHLSPDTAGVDVYLTAFRGGTHTLWLSDVGYGDISGYRRMQSGEYAVSMRPHGASASSKPVLTWTIDLRAGAAYTAAAVGDNAKLHGVILNDTLTQPGPGRGLVRIVQASSRAGTVSLSTESGSTLSRSTAFGATSRYVAIPAGRQTLEVRSATHPGMTSSVSTSIPSRSITSVILLDARKSGVVLHTTLDAAGAASTPAGPVPAGGGGTASEQSRPDSGPLYGVIAVTAAAMLAVGVLLVRRRAAVGRG